MKRDINDQVAGYRGLVESLAPPLVGRNQAELDDLVQEGLIDVWQSLERGVTPSELQIRHRMTDYVRLLGAQLGRGRGAEGDAVSYATLLPMDAFPIEREIDEEDESEEQLVPGVDGIWRPANVGPDLNY